MQANWIAIQSTKAEIDYIGVMDFAAALVEARSRIGPHVEIYPLEWWNYIGHALPADKRIATWTIIDVDGTIKTLMGRTFSAVLTELGDKVEIYPTLWWIDYGAQQFFRQKEIEAAAKIEGGKKTPDEKKLQENAPAPIGPEGGSTN